MRSSILAFALALASTAPTAAQLGPGSSEYDRPDLRGSYWDVSINTQSGRPGYTITDFGASFHSPVLSNAIEGNCHYSFVPQGTSPPATTNECTVGLKYSWDYTNVTFLEHDFMWGNNSLTAYGLSTKIETTRRSDGMSSVTKGEGRVEISHYCVNGWGCGYANGCISLKCNDEKTKKK